MSGEPVYQARTALLGGDAQDRGLFLGRTGGEAVVLAMAFVASIVVATVLGPPLGIIAGALVVAIPLAVVAWPANDYGRRLYHRVPVVLHARIRRWRGEHAYRSGAAAAGALPDGTPVDVAPPPSVGRVRWLRYQRPGDGPLAILLHEHAAPSVATAVLEIAGRGGGIRDDPDYDADAARFGRLLTHLANSATVISGVQLLNRVLPVDPTEHLQFVDATRDDRAPQVLHDSYDELTLIGEEASERHHNYLVVRIVLDDEFFEQMRALGLKGPAGIATVVAEEVHNLVAACKTNDIQVVQGLGPGPLASLVRSLYDPDHPVDDHGGMSPQLAWPQKMVNDLDDQACVVHDRWYHRVGHIPVSGWPRDPVGMQWLAPLLTGINPATIRTVSVLMDLEPAAKARQRAVADLTVDIATASKAAREGQIDGGQLDSRISHAEQRREDVRLYQAGGVTTATYLLVSATSALELNRACRRVEFAAGGCGIARIEWMRCEHDLAMVNVLPFFRGLRAEGTVRPGRKGRRRV